MKICGCCNNKYDEKEIICPMCGSQLLKHESAGSVVDEYRKIEEEIKKRRHKRIILGCCAGTVAMGILIAGVWTVVYFNNPQREIDRECKVLYEMAAEQIKESNYEDAIETLNEIDVSWYNYDKVEAKKIEAIKGQLIGTIVKYEAAGNYESIIIYINENIEDINADSDIADIYNESIVKYKEDVMAVANKYVESADYSSAITVLTAATKLIGADADIENRLFDVVKQEVFNTIAEYKQKGDFASAIRYINENLDTYENKSELLIELSDCEEQFRICITQEAKAAYEAEGYEKAVEKINSGLSVLSYDEELMKLKEKYESLAPVHLRELNSYIGELTQYTYAKDSMGNTYQHCFVAFSEDEATYDIGMRYKTFKATVAVTKAKVNTALFTDTYAGIIIYGDGKVLYENTMLSTSTKPFEISLDVSGVTDLTIEMIGKDTNLNYDNGLYVIVADAKLQGTID